MSAPLRGRALFHCLKSLCHLLVLDGCLSGMGWGGGGDGNVRCYVILLSLILDVWSGMGWVGGGW